MHTRHAWRTDKLCLLKRRSWRIQFPYRTQWLHNMTYTAFNPALPLGDVTCKEKQGDRMILVPHFRAVCSLPKRSTFQGLDIYGATSDWNMFMHLWNQCRNCPTELLVPSMHYNHSFIRGYSGTQPLINWFPDTWEGSSIHIHKQLSTSYKARSLWGEI